MYEFEVNHPSVESVIENFNNTLAESLDWTPYKVKSLDSTPYEKIYKLTDDHFKIDTSKVYSVLFKIIGIIGICGLYSMVGLLFNWSSPYHFIFFAVIAILAFSIPDNTAKLNLLFSNAQYYWDDYDSDEPNEVVYRRGEAIDSKLFGLEYGSGSLDDILVLQLIEKKVCKFPMLSSSTSFERHSVCWEINACLKNGCRFNILTSCYFKSVKSDALLLEEKLGVPLFSITTEKKRGKEEN